MQGDFKSALKGKKSMSPTSKDVIQMGRNRSEDLLMNENKTIKTRKALMHKLGF